MADSRWRIANGRGDEKYIDQVTLDTLYAEGETLAKSINAFRKTRRLD